MLSKNSVACDFVAAYLMGFSSLKIPQIYKAFEVEKYPLVNFAMEAIEITLNNSKIDLNTLIKSNLGFVPASCWRNYI